MGLLLLGAGVGLPVAVVQAAKALRGGPGEMFEVYERGIAHTTKSGRRAWTWRQGVLGEA